MARHPKTGRRIWGSEAAGRVRYFSPREFACRCCGQAHIDLDLVLLLDELRDRCGFPLVVTSGYRCPRYNRRKKYGPAHPTGLAVDFAVSGPRAYELVKQALACDIPRIGIKQRGHHTSRFVHLDIVPWWDKALLPTPCIWTYGHGRAK